MEPLETNSVGMLLGSYNELDVHPQPYWPPVENSLDGSVFGGHGNASWRLKVL